VHRLTVIFFQIDRLPKIDSQIVTMPYYYLDIYLFYVYGHSWRNLEDAFYWDPVFAAVLKRSDTSSVVSLLMSPRALTPSFSDTWRTDTETNQQVLRDLFKTSIFMQFRELF